MAAREEDGVMRYASLSEDGTVSTVYGYDPRWRTEPDPCPMVANPRYPSPDGDQPALIPQPGWEPTFRRVATGIAAVEVPPHVCAGHRWDGSTWVAPPPPPPPVPASVTAFQARAALLAAGLLDDVEAVIASADRATQIAWEYALSWERSSPTLATLAAGLGLGETEIDDLFRAASIITA